MSTEHNVDEIELPPDLAEAFRLAGGLDDRPETLGRGLTAVTDRLNEAGVTVTLEDMYQPEPTSHAVRVGGTVEHVPCVMDALIVALRLDADPVEVHSEPPGGGETVRLRVTGDEVTVTPTSAVISFGIGLDESRAVDSETLDDSIKDALNDPNVPSLTTCSVINAFPDSAAYDRWAADVSDAAVMELDVEAMLALSQRAARAHVAD